MAEPSTTPPSLHDEETVDAKEHVPTDRDLDAATSPADRILEAIDPPRPEVLPPGLSLAQIERVQEGRALVVPLQGPRPDAIWVDVAKVVDPVFLQQAAEDGQLALLSSTSQGPILFGVVQTRSPKVLRLEADELEIVARRRLTLKSGRSALQLRADGAIELLGTRISATSRGVFRILGRALRLN